MSKIQWWLKKKVGTGIIFSAGIIHGAELGEKDWKTWFLIERLNLGDFDDSNVKIFIFWLISATCNSCSVKYQLFRFVPMCLLHPIITEVLLFMLPY